MGGGRPVAVSLLVLGLALNAATIIYDLTHWDVVYYVPPEVAVNRNGQRGADR